MKRVWSYNHEALWEIQDGRQYGRHDWCKQSFGHNSCCIYAIVTFSVPNDMFSNTRKFIRIYILKTSSIAINNKRIIV